ncbi:RHS repeat-associated core domain-containing protein, partial [Prosthecobacter debontii]
GMWLSRDPAGFVDGPNLYAYVKQNPWTAWDPLGLAELTDAIRSHIATEIQSAVEVIELAHGPTGDNLTLAKLKHAKLQEMMAGSKYADYLMLEQSINAQGGAVKKQSYQGKNGNSVSKWPANSRRPDITLLNDSDHKSGLAKGGGVDMKGKVDAIFDYKTGVKGMEPEWVNEVANRTGIKPGLVLEARPGKNLASDFASARGVHTQTTRLLSVVDMFSTATAVHQSVVDEMDRQNDANPYIGVTDGGLEYSLTFKRKHFSFLPISYKTDHGILVRNGPFAGGEMKISEERWEGLNSELEKKVSNETK